MPDDVKIKSLFRTVIKAIWIQVYFQLVDNFKQGKSNLAVLFPLINFGKKIHISGPNNRFQLCVDVLGNNWSPS